MKSEYLQKFSPLREYYESGELKTETYLIHMVYIIYNYSKSGEIMGININGIEYPSDIELTFDEANGKLNIKT